MSYDKNNPFGDLQLPPELFGQVVNELATNKPSLFTPRSLGEFKNELMDLGKYDENIELTEFDVLLDDLQRTHAARMNELLGNMSDSQFIQAYMRLLAFGKPKLKAIETKEIAPSELTQINITVINNNNGEKKKTYDISTVDAAQDIKE